MVGYPEATVNLRPCPPATLASGISSNLNGRTSKFGWLQAPATMGARGKCRFYL